MSFKRRLLRTQSTSHEASRSHELEDDQKPFVFSTGVPSLDDVLGEGIPAGSIFLLLAPDLHSTYGTLVHKYFISQGLHSSHFVLVVDQAATPLVETCMWTSDIPSYDLDNAKATYAQSNIAWRYKHLRSFKTTVDSVA